MPVRRSVPALAAAVLLSTAGCDRLRDVPSATVITCGSTAECPGGRICGGGRCVLPSDLGTPPDLVLPPSGQLAVTPAVGRVGTQFTILVEATKDLREPPRVILGLDPLLELECVPTSSGSRTYTCPYTATGAERGGLGGPVPIDVRLLDAVGQTVTKNGVGRLALDFTPPQLAAASVAPSSVPLGGVLQVFFTTDEPLGVRPVLVASRPLEAGGEPRFPLDADPGTLNYRFTHLVTPSDDPGPISFQVELQDVVGNGRTGVPVGAVTVDNLVPTVTQLAVTPARIDPTGVLTVTFDASEAGSVTASVGGRPLSCGARQPSSPSITCTRAMAGDELAAGEEAGQPVVVNVRDAAGNVGGAVGNVVFDFRPPDLLPGSVAVALAPPAGSLVGAVTALRAGASIRISLTADEPLAAPPVILTDPTLAFTVVSQAGPFYVLEHVLTPEPHVQGPYAVRVSLTDVAGNTVERAVALPAPGLRVDTAPPSSPDVGTGSRIVYERYPWGTAATGGAPLFRVAGAPGAVESGATVVAFDGRDVGTAREIGRAVAGADGAFGPMALVPADRRAIHLVAVDGAGNPSDADGAAAGTQAVQVRDVVWTATPWGKVVGSTAENPHRLESRARWLGALVQDAGEEVTLPAATRGSLGWALAATQAWPTGGTVAAYDARRGRVVVPQAGAVAEWDGQVWTSVVAAGGPTSPIAATYDARRGEVLVFGASCSGGTTLWAWTGSGWEPRSQGTAYTARLGSATLPPGPYRAAQMVYDERRGEVILAPGAQQYAGPYVCGDVAGALDYRTYRWDGQGWAALPEPAAPSGSDGVLLAYDVAQGLVLRKNATATYVWDGQVWTTVVVGAGDGAPTFAGSQLQSAYDPVLGRVLVRDASALWSWGGDSWRREGATIGGGLVRDPRAAVVLDVAPDGVRRWSGAGWALVKAPAAAPPLPVSVVHVPARGAFEAFDASADVFRWDAAASVWQQVATGAAVGNGSGLSGAAVDPATGLVVGYHSASQTTWTWDGSGWTTVTPADTVRPLSGSRGLTTVAGEGVCSLDGQAYGVTAWQTDRWVRRYTGGGGSASVVGAPAATPGGFAFAMQPYYSPDTRIWEWVPGGGFLTAYGGAGLGIVVPIAADGAGRTFLLQRSATLLLSGGAATDAHVEAPSGHGFPTSASASGWDPALASVVVLSGGQTWHLETERLSRPGQLFRVAWPTGGGPGGDCFLPGAACEVQEVEVAWRGLAAAEEGVTPAGADLAVWDGLAWVPVASAGASPTFEAAAAAAVTDPAVLSRLLGPGAELDLAIVLPAGTLPAPLLRSDDVSLSVRYRLPP